MEKDEIITLFNDLICGNRDEITYSNGYKLFEEIYEILSKEINFIKETDKLYTTIRMGNNNEKRK